MDPCLHLIQLSSFPILEQLKLEEALLRADDRNWCLINKGTPPAIVMGISGKPELLINSHIWQQQPVPLIRRFTGGGTVIVDENTHFITFIANSKDLNVPPFSHPIMKWTEQLYTPLFQSHRFQMLDNDYVIGSKKCGGNAQYLSKERWLHHTSFLWDYSEERMNYLLLPTQMPAYRQQRAHAHFLCRLSSYFPSQLSFSEKFHSILNQRFMIKEMDLIQVTETLSLPHRKTTKVESFF